MNIFENLLDHIGGQKIFQIAAHFVTPPLDPVAAIETLNRAYRVERIT